MKAWEYEAVIYDGAIYCLDCLPIGIYDKDEDVYPIFADSEWSEPGIACDACGHLHDYMALYKD